jgi:hypothetical protein
MKTTLEEEINIWLLFWGSTALIFIIMWCIAHFKINTDNNKINTDNKKGVKASKNDNTNKKTKL